MSGAQDLAYDDDRPGMMRVHVAVERGRLLAARYSISELRRFARQGDVNLFGARSAVDIATKLAAAGCVDQAGQLR